ncbi:MULTISPECIES: hypothetical protein [unclassified Sphingomonas]|uniref:hypothetical protein n=2 Tax=Sphingomonas TaxID=13687 RepID=UPI000831B314|nr:MULTISPECIES: hypothetical protein [unclassified Sphingomonas]
MTGQLAGVTANIFSAPPSDDARLSAQAVNSLPRDALGIDVGTLGAEIALRFGGDPQRIRAEANALQAVLTPVEQGELARALAGRDQVSTILVAARTDSPNRHAPETRLGNPIWGTRVAGMEAQLQRESQLQRGVNADYSRDLATSAGDVDELVSGFGRSDYRQAVPRERVSTESGNPLAVDAISQRNAELTIRDLTRRIGANDAELQRLTAENIGLSARIGINIVGNNRELEQRRDANTNRIAELVVDNVSLSLERNKAVNDARLQASRPENANMYRALAGGADAGRPPVIFINGVNTDVNRSAMQAMELSALFRAPVDHVVNVSSMDKMISVGRNVLEDNPSNRLPDLNVTDQRLQQLMSGNRQAAATAANAILDQLLNGDGKVKLIGYSQGAAIGNEALRMVNDYLRNSQGMSESARAQMLSRVEFLGIGPAAGERHIAHSFAGSSQNPGVRDIPELRAVNYHTLSDRNDPIPALLNVSNPDGSSPATTNIGRALQAAVRLASPTGILPHLSYFESYATTDPGSQYNAQAAVKLHEWYAGKALPDNILLSPNDRQGR